MSITSSLPPNRSRRTSPGPSHRHSADDAGAQHPARRRAERLERHLSYAARLGRPDHHGSHASFTAKQRLFLHAGNLQRRTSGIAYLHLVQSDGDDAPQFTEEFRQAIRARFLPPIIVAGKYDLARAEWVFGQGYADLLAFGRPFVANPDLPRWLAEQLPLTSINAEALFGESAHGYSDYAPWTETKPIIT